MPIFMEVSPNVFEMHGDFVWQFIVLGFTDFDYLCPRASVLIESLSKMRGMPIPSFVIMAKRSSFSSSALIINVAIQFEPISLGGGTQLCYLHSMLVPHPKKGGGFEETFSILSSLKQK